MFSPVSILTAVWGKSQTHDRNIGHDYPAKLSAGYDIPDADARRLSCCRRLFPRH
jgi:hypothetical protein